MTNKEKIDQLVSDGMTLKQIAKAMKVTVEHVRQVQTGKLKGGKSMSDALDIIIQVRNT